MSDPGFIVIDDAGRNWHFDSEAEVVGFAARMGRGGYAAYARLERVSRLRAVAAKWRRRARDLREANFEIRATLEDQAREAEYRLRLATGALEATREELADGLGRGAGIEAAAREVVAVIDALLTRLRGDPWGEDGGGAS